MRRDAPIVRLTVLPAPDATEGDPAESIRDRLISFTFEDTEGGAGKLTLLLDNHDLELFESGDDVIGGRVLEAAWGYPDAMAPPRRCIVKRVIGGVELSVEADGVGIQMHREERCRAWHGLTRSEVVRDVAAGAGFSEAYLDVEDTEHPIDTINQLGETDARLLRRLAAREGFVFWIDDLGIHWRRRRFDAPPAHVFHWQTDPRLGSVISWNIESNLVNQAGKVSVRGRDPVEKRDIKQDASAESEQRTTLGDVRKVVDPETGETHYERINATSAIRTTASPTDADTKREASARFVSAEREAVQISATVIGTPGLRAKEPIEMRGLTTRFSGLYYVTRCKHEISSSGYICTLNATRDALGKMARTAAEDGADGALQTGERNEQEVDDDEGGNEPKVIKEIDPETGRARYTYRHDRGVTLDPDDPEVRGR